MDLPNITLQSLGVTTRNPSNPKAPGSILRSLLVRLCQLLQDVCGLLRQLLSSLIGMEANRTAENTQPADQGARDNRDHSVSTEEECNEQNGTEVGDPRTQHAEERVEKNESEADSTEPCKDDDARKERETGRVGEKRRDNSTETRKVDSRTEQEEERARENDSDQNSTEPSRNDDAGKEMEKDRARENGSEQNSTNSSKDDGPRILEKERVRETETEQNSTQPCNTVGATTEQENERVRENDIEEKPTEPSKNDDASEEQEKEKIRENESGPNCSETDMVEDATKEQKKERDREKDNGEEQLVDHDKHEENNNSKVEDGEEQTNISPLKMDAQEVQNETDRDKDIWGEHNNSKQHHASKQHNASEQHNARKQHNVSEQHNENEEQTGFQGNYDLTNGRRAVDSTAQSDVIDPPKTVGTKERDQEKEKNKEKHHNEHGNVSRKDPIHKDKNTEHRDDVNGGMHVENNTDRPKTDVEKNTDRAKGGEKHSFEQDNTNEEPAFKGQCDIEHTAEGIDSVHTSDKQHHTGAKKDYSEQGSNDELKKEKCVLQGEFEFDNTTKAVDSLQLSSAQGCVDGNKEREKDETGDKENAELDHSNDQLITATAGRKEDTAVVSKEEGGTDTDDNEKEKAPNKIDSTNSKEVQVKSKEEQVKNTVEQAKKRAEKAKLSAEQAHVKTEQAKTKAEQAMSKEEQAKSKAEQALTKARQAQIKAEQAKTKAEVAKNKDEQAKNKAEKVRTKAEEVKTKIDHAKTKEEQAKNKAEQASAKAEQAKCKAVQASVKAELAKKKEEEAKTKAEQAKITAEKAQTKEEQVKTKAEKASVKAEQAQIKAEKTKTGGKPAKRKSGKTNVIEEQAESTEEHASNKVEQTKAGAKQASARADKSKEQQANDEGELVKNKEELAKNNEEQAKSKEERSKNKTDQGRIKTEQATNKGKHANADGVHKQDNSAMISQTENGTASSTTPDRQKARKAKKKSPEKAGNIKIVTTKQQESKTLSDKYDSVETNTGAPQNGAHAGKPSQDLLDIQHVKRGREQQDDLEKQTEPPQAKRYRGNTEQTEQTMGQKDTSNDGKSDESLQRSDMGVKETLITNGNVKELQDFPERQERPQIGKDPVPGNELQTNKESTTETGLHNGDTCETPKLLNNGQGTKEDELKHSDKATLMEKTITGEHDLPFLKPAEAQDVMVNIIAEAQDKIAFDSESFMIQDTQKAQNGTKNMSEQPDIGRPSVHTLKQTGQVGDPLKDVSEVGKTPKESSEHFQDGPPQKQEDASTLQDIADLSTKTTEAVGVLETSGCKVQPPQGFVKSSQDDHQRQLEQTDQVSQMSSKMEDEVVEMLQGYAKPERMLKKSDCVVQTPKLNVEPEYRAAPGDDELAEETDGLSPKYKSPEEIVELPEDYIEPEGVLETSDYIVETPKLHAEAVQGYQATPGKDEELLAEETDQLSPKYKVAEEIVELPEGFTEPDGVLETSDCVVEQPEEDGDGDIEDDDDSKDNEEKDDDDDDEDDNDDDDDDGGGGGDDDDDDGDDDDDDDDDDDESRQEIIKHAENRKVADDHDEEIRRISESSASCFEQHKLLHNQSEHGADRRDDTTK